MVTITFNSLIPECLPSFEDGWPNNGRQACLVFCCHRRWAFLRPTRSVKIMALFLTMLWQCSEWIPHCCFQNKTRGQYHNSKYSTRNAPVLTYLWPNQRAQASAALPHWCPWLYWPSLGLVSGVPGKCQYFRLFVNFHPLFHNHFTFVNDQWIIKNNIFNYSWFWFSKKIFKRLKVRLSLLISWVFWTNFGSKKVTTILFFCTLTEKQRIFQGYLCGQLYSTFERSFQPYMKNNEILRGSFIAKFRTTKVVYIFQLIFRASVGK